MLEYTMYVLYLALPVGSWGLSLLCWWSPRYRQVQRQLETSLLKFSGYFWLLVSLALICSYYLLRAG